MYSAVSAQSAEVATLGNISSCGHTSMHATRDTGNPHDILNTDNSHDISIRYENNKAWPRWDYADNHQAYASLVEIVNRLAYEQSTLRAVVIKGAASPVGSEEYNHRLALRRAEILRSIIRKMRGGENLRINVISAGEDWGSFHSYIEQHYHQPNRNEVLSILRTNLSNDEKERALQALDSGKTWRILANNFMASARNAAVICIVEIADLAPKIPSLKFAPALIALNLDNLRERIEGGDFNPHLNLSRHLSPNQRSFASRSSPSVQIC